MMAQVRGATPQLAETVEGVIFNPTWTVPQSIVQGEGLELSDVPREQWNGTGAEYLPERFGEVRDFPEPRLLAPPLPNTRLKARGR